MKNERTSLEGEERDGSLEVLNVYLAELIAGGDGTTATPELIDDLQSRSILQEPGHVAAENWLRSLNVADVPERIIPPNEQRMALPMTAEELLLDQEALQSAYPNPTDGIAYVVCNVPEGVEQATVRVQDLNGRLVAEQRIATGSAIVELNLSGAPAGVYAAELELDGMRSGTVKLTVQ